MSSVVKGLKDLESFLMEDETLAELLFPYVELITPHFLHTSPSLLAHVTLTSCTRHHHFLHTHHSITPPPCSCSSLWWSLSPPHLTLGCGGMWVSPPHMPTPPLLPLDRAIQYLLPWYVSLVCHMHTHTLSPHPLSVSHPPHPFTHPLSHPLSPHPH